MKTTLWSAFWKGFRSTFDLWPTVDLELGTHEDDARSIGKDWEKVLGRPR
jgi:hypothetical protein